MIIRRYLIERVIEKEKHINFEKNK